jgi:hypothetical protein
MFYTVHSLPPRTLSRRTTYRIVQGNRTIFSVSFGGTITPSEIGHFIRYFSPFTIPRTLPFGVYTFRGTLAIDGQSQTRSWTFAVIRPNYHPLNQALLPSKGSAIAFER